MPTGNGQPRTYSIAADTATGAFKSSFLKNEIEAETGITTVLLRVDRTGDVLDIWFVADLSGGEITLLDAVVNNHLGGVPPPEMEFVGATENSSTNNSIDINVPAGVVDGDTLLLQVTQSDNEDGNINSISGWANPVANAGSGGSPPSEPATSIFTRIASSEPASYNATVTNGGGVGMVARMLAFRVGHPTTILDVSITLATHTDDMPNPPSNTPVTRGCFAVAMWWHDDDLGVYGSIPAGYTDPDGLGSVVTSGGGNGCSIGSAIKLLSGDVTAENPGDFDVTDSDEGGTATILLRPQFEGLPPPVAAEGDVEIQDEGVSLTLAAKLINFLGAGVTAVLNGAGIVDVTISGGGSGITVEDEGTPLATQATTLDFVGAGVVASGTGATKTITIPGGAGVFGSDFNSANSLGESTTTSATLQQKLRMSVNVAAGNYLLHWAWVGGQNNNEKEVRFRVQIDDSITLTDFTDVHGDGSDQWDNAMAGHRIVALDGTHDIDVDFSRPDGGTATIRDTVLTLFRIS